MGQWLAAGHGIVEVLTGTQIHGAAVPGEDLHRTQAVTRLHQALRLQLVEAVVQQTGMVVPIVGGVDGHRNELPAVPGGAGDQNPACRLGIAGLDALGSLVAPQDLIVVGEAPAPPFNAFGGYRLG